MEICHRKRKGRPVCDNAWQSCPSSVHYLGLSGDWVQFHLGAPDEKCIISPKLGEHDGCQ